MWTQPSLTRRELLARTGCGFGMLALADLLAAEADATTFRANPREPRSLMRFARPITHPRAKRVIFLYMPGGPSHVDLFDPKPRLSQDNGKPLPFEKPKLERTKTGNLLASPWKFARHGQSGIEVSELLPGMASCIDDICVIRSMVADNINHTGAALQMCTGEQAFSRPSMGSWLTYGLGTENQNLPGFVVVSPAAVFQGAQLWASSFLPSAYQGTLVRDLNHPIANLADPAGNLERQRRKLDALGRLNAIHKRDRVIDSQLDARIASFELAFRMQREAPEAFDIHRESRHTHKLYGIDNPATDLFGRQCLLARRLVERGVRFVQLFDAPANNAWDHHSGLRENLPKRCQAVDQPIAALLDRPQESRTAGRHAGSLGRRVRPHADRRGQQRPGASPVRFYDVDGRRRRARRYGPRRHRRIRLARRPRQSPRPRPARHHPAPDGSQPREADLPPRRSRLSPHRRVWPRREGDPRVKESF